VVLICVHPAILKQNLLTSLNFITLLIKREPTANPVPGGYKYGDLALQVGGVSDEAIKYGREF
jgi:hypothetical protein